LPTANNTTQKGSFNSNKQKKEVSSIVFLAILYFTSSEERNLPKKEM